VQRVSEVKSYAFVVAGLDPAIHAALRLFRSSMDALVKSAHDERLAGVIKTEKYK
jgi:hypothetical protein